MNRVEDKDCDFLWRLVQERTVTSKDIQNHRLYCLAVQMWKGGMGHYHRLYCLWKGGMGHYHRLYCLAVQMWKVGMGHYHRLYCLAV